MSLSAFHHVALTVTNLDATARRYLTVLGTEETFRDDWPAPGGRIS